jgi:hypothetical protein
MRVNQIDPIAYIIVSQKRKELELQYEKARQRRLAKRLPITGEWHARWYFYIEDEIEKARLNYLNY